MGWGWEGRPLRAAQSSSGPGGPKCSPPARPDVWGPSFSRGQPDWGERPLPSPPGLTPCLAGPPILGAGVASPWLPRQARPKRKGVWVGRWGSPGVGVWVQRLPPLLLRVHPGWGGFRTLTCVGWVASQFGGTGGSDEEYRFSDCLYPTSCSHQESGEWALSPSSPTACV